MPRIPLGRALSLIVALVAVVALAACTSSKATSTPTGTSTGTSGSGSASSGTGVGTVAWHNCTISGVLGTSLKCASLQVPLNYSDPGGRKITLALSEGPATAPASQQLGDLLVNPGGPGASGRSLAAAVADRAEPAAWPAGTTSSASTRAGSARRCPR